MQEAVKTFYYSAKRASYVNIIIVFVFLLIIEGGATELLTALLVHILWIKLAILIGTIGLSFLIFIMLLFPLWTKHHLTATQLHLHYGLALNVRIPLEAISEVHAIRKSSDKIQPFSARYEAKKQRIIACFSDQDMVLLIFAQPLMLKLGARRCTTTNILLNVDQRDTFLDALTAARAACLEHETVQ